MHVPYHLDRANNLVELRYIHQGQGNAGFLTHVRE